MSAVLESGLFLPDYAAGTLADDFSWWCREKLVQSVDRWSGRPLALEPWQERFFSEAMATDEEQLPYWKIAGLIVSRKNGKSAMIAAACLYQLLEQGELGPEVLMAASSDKQAGRLFDAAVSFTRRNGELGEMVHLREYLGEISRIDGRGKIIRMASDPNRAHGYNASKVAVDELHAFSTPSLRRAWGAFVSGGGARDSSQVMFISTAGDAFERDDSILGQMLNANEARGDLEVEPGLTISRHHAARTLIYNYSAPTDSRHDIDALKLANPASWISLDYLREQAESPALSNSEILQLHGCVWSSQAERFIDAGKWQECEASVAIPDGSDIYVGIDMSLSEDASAVAWAWPRGDGTVVVAAHVWAARPDVAADEFVSGGEIDPRDVESFVTDVLGARYRVREIAYDPALFSRSAHELKDRGFTVAPVAQQSALMAEAWKTFVSAVNQKVMLHERSQKTLTSHVTNAVAEMTDRGWRVKKSKNSRKIDALVACAIAHWRAAVAGTKPSVYEKRGLLEFRFDDEGDEE